MGFQFAVMFIDFFMVDVTYGRDITKDDFKNITVMLLIKRRLFQKCCSIFT